MWKKVIKLSFIFALAFLLVKPMVVQAAEDGTSWKTAKGLKVGTITVVEGVPYYYYKNTSQKPVILKFVTQKIEGQDSYPSIYEYQKVGNYYRSATGNYSSSSSVIVYSKVNSGETMYYKASNRSTSDKTYTGSFNLEVSVASLPDVKVGQSVTTLDSGETGVYTFTAPETGVYSFDCSCLAGGGISVTSLDHRTNIYSNGYSGDDRMTGIYLGAGCQYLFYVYNYGDVTWSIRKASNPNSPVLSLQTIPSQLYTGDYVSPRVKLYYRGYDIERDLGGSCGWNRIYGNIFPGTAYGIISYSFEYEGSSFSGFYYTTFKVVQDIGVADVSGITSPVYTGKPVAPKATVKISGETLKEGVDYKIVADSNVNAGAGRKATIQGIGKYDYTKTITYTITKGAQNIQCDGVITTYKKAKKFALGATASGAMTYVTSNAKVATIDKNGKVKPKGYGKAIITISAAPTANVNAGSKQITVIVTSKPTKLTSVKSTAKKKAIVKIKKATGAQGYEISYSMDPEFKSGVKTVNTKKASTTLKKLKSKKTYYVRVRSYRKVKGEKLYSAYSTAKKVKIK